MGNGYLRDGETMQGYHRLLTEQDMAAAEKLLASAGLGMPAGTDFGIGYYEDGVLTACGFLAGNVLCGFCVAVEARGGGVSTGLLSRLVLHGRERGISRFFIFTKASEAEKFIGAGFTLVAKSNEAALLEQGRPDCADWLAATRARMDAAFGPAPAGDATADLGAIVMNANPFTRGHEYLARTAAEFCERLLVFVVEEDVSVVPFAVRFRLVREALAHRPDVLVLPSGPYMVSRASFPAYFTADAARGAVHAGLDCAVFAERIAPGLGISTRFVGTEPYDPVTREYNAVMARRFAVHGLTLREIPRLERGGAAVSASRVRALLRREPDAAAWRELEDLLPPPTFAFLRSGEGADLRRVLLGHEGRH